MLTQTKSRDSGMMPQDIVPNPVCLGLAVDDRIV
jgi:hypothetical protein